MTKTFFKKLGNHLFHKLLNHPKVLTVAMCTSMFERLGFYILSFVLVLYVKGTFGLSDKVAFLLFGVFSGLVYVTPAIGGYLADNIYGIRRCIIIGLFFEALGFAVIALPQKVFLFLGLTSIIVGVGFFKTGPTHLMARSYKPKDPRIDSGFTLYYMIMNIGGILAPILAGVMQKYYGWHVAFLTASASLLLALLTYFAMRKLATSSDVKIGKEALPLRKWFYLLLGIITCIICCYLLLTNLNIAYISLIIAVIGVVAYLFYEILQSSREDKLKIAACIILIIMGWVFNLLYFQCFTSITLFMKRSMTHSILGVHIPTVTFLALDSIWIVILSPILAYMYSHLGHKAKDLTVPTKFALGLFLISACFLLLGISTYFAGANDKVAPYWVIVAFFLFALGELFIAALGVAMVTHIAPKRMYGAMMGAWYLIALGLAASSSGIFANIASVGKNIHDSFAVLIIYQHAFLEMGIISLIITVLAFAISPILKRMAKL